MHNFESIDIVYNKILSNQETLQRFLKIYKLIFCGHLKEMKKVDPYIFFAHYFFKDATCA